MPTGQHLNWGAEALWLQLQPQLPGLSVEVVASLGSTNTELMERARRAADSQPCLLVAEQQTGGRGRQGKAWQSSVGASLTFSLALPLAPIDWSGLSLAVGLALADALDPPLPGTPPRLGLKWPNDLLVLDAAAGADAIGRKLGGILIETMAVADQRIAVVGVGLNLLPQTIPDLGWGYGCLQEWHPGITAPGALARVAAPLLRTLLAFEREGFAPLRERFAARDVLLGRAVGTTRPEAPQGVGDGVDAAGVLWLRLPGEAGRRVPVSSGEVSVLRGVAAVGAGTC
jgi:BirA family biotin operon repressor/biotin-[acetyl-CoA-carboxylase] ligase